MLRSIIVTSVFLLGACGAATAGPEDFSTGPVIADFGKVANVPGAPKFAEDAAFKVSFDVAKAAEPGEVSRSLESAARLINMHAAHGLAADRTQVAIVVHGPASKDLVNDAAYGGDNTNAELIAALIDAGVSIELCGQTAAYRGISESDLLLGVEMSVSAMTAHAQLQQDGYTLNPF